jgi:hypothetical protein
MQFLHAMASDAQETAGDTEAKILEWVRFSYDYASGQLSDTAQLCVALKTYPAIGSALVGDVDSYICKGNEKFGPRTVGELFGFRCKNVVTSATCWVDTSIRERKLAALGAILHAIQDSYSQAHAQRGPCVKGAAVIRQAAVGRFLNYAEQDGRQHARADAWPVVDAVDHDIAHPVIASAQVLAFFAAATHNTDALVDYVRDHVLGLQSTSALATAGDCYIRRRTFARYERSAVRAYRNRQLNAVE